MFLWYSLASVCSRNLALNVVIEQCLEDLSAIDDHAAGPKLPCRLKCKPCAWVDLSDRSLRERLNESESIVSMLD